MKRLLFVGDSLIEYYDWQARFPNYQVFNYGRSGETVQELLARSSSVVERGTEPDWLFVMSGINNVAMEDFGFLPAYGELLDNFRDGFPSAKLVACSLLPVRLSWVASSTLPRMNEGIKKVTELSGAFFFDIHDSFLADDGLADRRFLLEDGVHISDAGYAHWAVQVEKLLASR